jgi:hypothetical protein
VQPFLAAGYARLTCPFQDAIATDHTSTATSKAPKKGAQITAGRGSGRSGFSGG